MLRFFPAFALLILVVPVLFGLVGTLLPAFGYLPALGGNQFSLDAFKALSEQAGIYASANQTLIIGLASTFISVCLVMGFVAAWYGTRAFSAVQHLVSPLLAVPHAAAAFGFAFMIAPSGYIARLLSPWLTNWDRPPDLLIVNDPMGLALIAGLVVKEVPFLLLVTLAALPQVPAIRAIQFTQSLGYGRMAGFILAVWPAIYKQIRLPIFAVIAYASANVDMSIILGPSIPHTLPVRLVGWMNDPDLSNRFMACAGAFEAIAAALGASPIRIFFKIKFPMLLRAILAAIAVGFAVSIGQFLPTLLIGAGRFPTITTEAVALGSGGNRRIIGIYAFIQMMNIGLSIDDIVNHGLKLENVKITLNGDMLVNVDHTIIPGEILTVMGPSGSGKSTLLAFIGGFLNSAFSASGRVFCGSMNITDVKPQDRGAGLLFQDPLLFPHMSVGGNLSFALPANVQPKKKRHDMARSALDEVGLGGFFDRDPDTLSGGQKARVALARVLIAQPSFLLLDEPFSKLDANRRNQMRELVFDKAKNRSLPVLLVTHDQADADAAQGTIIEILPSLYEALENQGAAVLVAPPGAGKTTAVPLALLDCDWLGNNKIILLEPRRLAARTAARRMASSLGQKVGEQVGYRMRLDTKVSAQTKIEIVTEGVFQRMICDDPSLEGVGCVIFDEFHERSMDADFGLALTLDVRGALREDLRLIVMSATLDGARVSQLLDNAPIIESSGRMYPVDIRYSPRSANQRIEEAMASAIRKALIEEEGSILAFLPGQAEIRRTKEQLDGKLPANAYVAPLFGAMDIRDQDLATQRPEEGQRKIVLATALAETSITIDGVRIVIDSGLARLPSFEAALGISRLETKRASQASITQRAGRAGRTAPGVAIRLWQEAQTSALLAFETPEILQADLSTLVLDCLSWGITGPADLNFLDQPQLSSLNEARKLLNELGAIDVSGKLTKKGQALAKIGLEPRLASMVLEGRNNVDCVRRAFLALLLGERGLGGNSTDIAHRFERSWRDKSHRSVGLRKMAERIAKQVKYAETATGETSVGMMLCDAFPDRVAMARAGQVGQFIMANGRGVMVDEADPLASSKFIVAANVTGAAKSARALSLATLNEQELLERFQDEIKMRDSYNFDKKEKKLFRRTAKKLGAITLSQKPLPLEPCAEIEVALVHAVRTNGLEILPWSKTTNILRERLSWLHAVLGEDWPSMSD
ncbi:ATP-dependent RNA helicase HrpB [Nymphon striatum]|nr:ATP-dependent RNA helicase HrpB [Nymphon striatum]